MIFKLFKSKNIDQGIRDEYFQQLRKSEYFRLDNLDQTYLDYMGSNIYPQTLIDMHYHLLSEHVYGNPHSGNICSEKSKALIHESRTKVLEFFEAKNYECIFTSNATGAINLIAKNYPFNAQSALLLTVDNHVCVNRLREECERKEGDFEYVYIQNPDFNIDNNDLISKLHKYNDIENKLFVYPAQSNITGAKHNLNKISIAQKNGWHILLDAAAYVPTNKLSLKNIQPEFVCIDFYKIFGYPTGIGCLLVRKDMMPKLEEIKENADTGNSLEKEEFGKFEDGTPDFLSIPLIKEGLEFIEKVNMDRISFRIEKLTQWIMGKFQNQYHDNGKPLIKLYGPTNVSKRGGIFLINLFDEDGKQYPFEFVKQKADKNNISFRAGLFNNSAIDEIYKNEKQNLMAQKDENESLNEYMEEINGAIRLSIGIPTVQEDIWKFLKMTDKLKNKKYSQDSLI